MGWVASHIAGRSAYEFNDEYQQINPSTSLNWTGSHGIGITIKPHPDQYSYALFRKGNPNNDSDATGVDNSLLCYVTNGYLDLRLYPFNQGDFALWIRTLTPVMTGLTDVTYIEYVWNQDLKLLSLYVNGVQVPINIISISSYASIFYQFTSIFNSNSTYFIFGKDSYRPQFKGTIYDAFLYKKVRTPAEITATYNLVKDPSISLGGEKILFLSNRFTSPARDQLWIAGNKFQNQQSFATSVYSQGDFKYLYSSNSSINNTKVGWIEYGNGLIIANRDGNNKQTLPRTDSVDYTEFCFAPNGTEVYYTKFNSSNSRTSIYKSTLNANNTLTGETLVKTDINYNYYNLDIKPDGLKIIARKVLNASPNSEFLVLMDIDGNNEIILQSFNGTEDITGLRWNKQGTKIGFSRLFYIPYKNAYRSKMFIMDSLGGNLKQLDGEDFDYYFTSFSPDGNYISYWVNQAPWNSLSIFRMDIFGRNKINLSNYNGFNDNSPEWLPS